MSNLRQPQIYDQYCDKSRSLPLELGKKMASGSTLAGIQISAITAMLDLDFTLSQMFAKIDDAVTVCVWPFEKIHNEVLHAVRDLTISRLKSKKCQPTPTAFPFFVHMLVSTEDHSVRVFVSGTQEAFDVNDVPVYAFCYR